MSRKKKRTRRGQDWIRDAERPPGELQDKKLRRLLGVLDGLKTGDEVERGER